MFLSFLWAMSKKYRSMVHFSHSWAGFKSLCKCECGGRGRGASVLLTSLSAVVIRVCGSLQLCFRVKGQVVIRKLRAGADVKGVSWTSCLHTSAQIVLQRFDNQPLSGGGRDFQCVESLMCRTLSFSQLWLLLNTTALLSLGLRGSGFLSWSTFFTKGGMHGLIWGFNDMLRDFLQNLLVCRWLSWCLLCTDVSL